MRRLIRPLPVLMVMLALPAACREHLAVDGARAWKRVEYQVAQGPRISGTAGNLAVRNWIASELERLGGRLEQQAFVDSSLGYALPLTNVIGRFGPDEGRRILLCAHFDTRPWCDQDPDTSKRSLPVPGANDGGSGVAVLLEVAELMSRKAPAIGVDLVFFDGEDLGNAENGELFSLGAKAYAARLPEAGAKGRPIAGFLFDMVGDKDLAIYPEGGSAVRAANLVALVSEAASATSAHSFHGEVRYTIIDDHVPLLDAGLPTVDIIDFDYPAWHTHRDTPDQVSAESLAEVSRLAAWLVYHSSLARP
ncbi:MAG: M28 family peptidase [Candidatus Eisenbacteria bacterium]